MGNSLPQTTYASFRTDKPGDASHSPELICQQHIEHPDELTQAKWNGCTTILELYEATMRRHSQLRFLGTRNNDKDGRPYEWKTFQQIYDLKENFARGMLSMGLCPVIQAEGQNFRFMGIFAKNREEWAVADLACMRSSVTIVPFFDSLGVEALSFVINQTELISMCVDKSGFENLIKCAPKCASLKNVIIFEKKTEEQSKKAQQAGLVLHSYEDVIEKGKSVTGFEFETPKPETIYMFCYTSGTTGDPKGAKMSHKGFVGTQNLVDYIGLNLRETDTAISYLPYAHIFEQCSFVFSLARGYSHGYYSGDPLKLVEDIQTLKPTFFSTVPRILNRVHGKIMEGVSTKTKFQQKMFHKAVKTKTENLVRKGTFKHCLYDNKVFKNIRNLFGGNMRAIITASAPISGEVLTFFKVAMGIHIYEVYGQTETNGPLTVTLPTDPTAGHVGGLIPTCKIRLRNVPEMGYLYTDNPPRGEIQTKGTHIFNGYFKNPEKTKEAIDDDGWLSTGDVAIVFPNGAIKIIDRAKNIFKLCQGEYIAPEKLENAYIQCPLIQFIFVYGDSLQAYLLAVIVPEPEQARKWATENGIDGKDLEELYRNEELKKAIIAQMDAKAKECNFSSLEKIKKIILTQTLFTVDNDLITPTFKIKRNNAKKAFLDEITLLYKDNQI